jgi:nucleoside-diphosphate-sugar epimerase
MPDGVNALLTLAAAPRARLTRTAYNLSAFSRSAAEIRDVVVAAFPNASIEYHVDAKRQGIVDSWPADVEDAAARSDWGFAPTYDFDRAFQEYLIPTIRERYRR